MPTFTSDHALIANDYPFSWIEPPRKYELLDEDAIIANLNGYAINDIPQLHGVTRADAISFQPSVSETFPNEDRLHVSTIALPNHPHTTSANLYIVLDGHAGPRCVEYAIEHLPGAATKAVQSLSAEDWSAPQGNSGVVCKTLARVIQDFDDSLRDAVMNVLPPVEQLEKLSDTEIEELVKDEKVLQTILRYHQGSTALIVLHAGRDIWTAGIGDCVAAVGTKTDGCWVTHVVSGPPHNIRTNPKEKEKVLRQHPGEEQHAVAKDRVLGLIAVSRALGDGVFKMPRPYLCVFMAMPSRVKGKLLVLKDIYQTPPYMTAEAETVHYQIPEGSQSVLLVTTDGLENPEYPYGTEQGETPFDPDHPHIQEEAWISAIGKRVDEGHKGNLAVQLVRDLLGDGEAGQHRASAFVGLDHPEDHYQDDTTLLVAVLES